MADLTQDARWDWDDAARAQRGRWLASSAQERLAWLERAIEFAAAAGAIDPDRR